MNTNTDVKEAYGSPEIKMSENIVQNLPLKLLIPMDLSIRLEVNETEITELAESFKIHGVLEPLLVRPSQKGKFEIVCGMRRFMAAQKAGLEAVPCIVKDMDVREAMEATLVENMQRENLSDYEVGRWFKLLLVKFPRDYPTQKVVGDRFNISHDMVSKLIIHYEAIENMKPNLPSNISTRVETLHEKVTREVRRAPPELQPKIIQTVIKKELSARETAELVDTLTVPRVDVKKEIEKLEKGAEKEKLTPEEVEKPQIVKPEVVEFESNELAGTEQPKTVPSMGDVEKVAEAIKKRRESPEEELFKTLAKYYPVSFIDEVGKRFGTNVPSAEKFLEYMVTIIDVMWAKIVELELVEEVFKEAASWRWR